MFSAVTGANVPGTVLDGEAEGPPTPSLPASHHRVIPTGVHQAVSAGFAGEPCIGRGACIPFAHGTRHDVQRSII